MVFTSIISSISTICDFSKSQKTTVQQPEVHFLYYTAAQYFSQPTFSVEWIVNEVYRLMPNLFNEILFSPTVEATILISGLDGLGYIASRMISSFAEKNNKAGIAWWWRSLHSLRPLSSLPLVFLLVVKKQKQWDRMTNVNWKHNTFWSV